MMEQYYYSGGSMRDFCRTRKDLLSILEKRLARTPIATQSKEFALIYKKQFGKRDQYLDVHRLYLNDSFRLAHFADPKDSLLTVDSEWMLTNGTRSFRNGCRICRFAATSSDSLYGCAYDIYGRVLARKAEEAWKQ